MIYYGNNDYRDYLAHHGVLGMKWGIRRYQPYSIGYQREGGEKGRFLGSNSSNSSRTARKIQRLEKKHAKVASKRDKRLKEAQMYEKDWKKMYSDEYYYDNADRIEAAGDVIGTYQSAANAQKKLNKIEKKIKELSGQEYSDADVKAGEDAVNSILEKAVKVDEAVGAKIMSEWEKPKSSSTEYKVPESIKYEYGDPDDPDAKRLNEHAMRSYENTVKYYQKHEPDKLKEFARIAKEQGTDDLRDVHEFRKMFEAFDDTDDDD